MPVSKIDTDLQSLLKAQIALDKYKDNSGYIKVTSPFPLLKHIEAKRLANEVKDLSTLDITDVELNFLSGTGLFTPDFLEWLRTVELPPVTVVIKNGELEIQSKGPLSELVLIETPLLSLISDHYYSVSSVKMNLLEEMVLSEAVRRFQTKSDILRDYDDIKISIGGTRNRFSVEWQNLLITMLIGEFDRKILSVDNPALSLVYGTDMHAFLNSDMWIDGWPTKDFYPSYPAPSDWKGSRYEFTTIDKFIKDVDNERDDFIFVLSDLSAFDIAHIKAHVGQAPNLVFNFDNITNDVPIRSPQLDVIRKISTKK